MNAQEARKLTTETARSGKPMPKATWISTETVFEMIAGIRAQYPETIFTPPKKGSPPDCYGAAGARLACDLIRQEIDEYLENEDLP